jgi:hypothetical protein
MTLDRRILFALVAGVAVGYFLFAGGSAPSPWQPAPDRPVLRWIARAAKSFLWIALVAEPPHDPVEQGRHLVHSKPVGDDGFPLVDHGQGW